MKHLPRTRYLIALGASVGLVAFYYFGDSTWRPIKARVAGERAVSQVVDELEHPVAERIPDLDTLTDGSPIAILAFKEERRLELWKERDTGWELARSYPFTGFSGKLGPKLREGDLQIPEGQYRVEYLNPNSSYHLSIKLDYPNEFDRKMAKADGRDELGYDIFIHGSNATVGCIPIGDTNIEELFYIVAKNGYRQTSVLIFPRDFRRGKAAPSIEAVEWESQLYSMLEQKLQVFQTSRDSTP